MSKQITDFDIIREECSKNYMIYIIQDIDEDEVHVLVHKAIKSLSEVAYIDLSLDPVNSHWSLLTAMFKASEEGWDDAVKYVSMKELSV